MDPESVNNEEQQQEGPDSEEFIRELLENWVPPSNQAQPDESERVQEAQQVTHDRSEIIHLHYLLFTADELRRHFLVDADGQVGYFEHSAER